MKNQTNRFTLVGGQVLFNVHNEDECLFEYCTIHNFSDHHMVDWPQNWRPDRKMMERICPHGVGHPDPDDITDNAIHGCDGCCKLFVEEYGATYANNIILKNHPFDDPETLDLKEDARKEVQALLDKIEYAENTLTHTQEIENQDVVTEAITEAKKLTQARRQIMSKLSGMNHQQQTLEDERHELLNYHSKYLVDWASNVRNYLTTENSFDDSYTINALSGVERHLEALAVLLVEQGHKQ